MQKPTSLGFGDVFRMKIKGENLRGSYPFCNDGLMKNSRLGSFSPIKDKKVFYETDTIYGH